MFEIRLHKLNFKRNGELIGKGEIQIMNFITFGDQDFPLMHSFFETDDSTKKKELIKSIVKKVVSSRITLPIANVKDGGTIIFGDEGYSMFHSQEIPTDFNWMILAMEIDDKTRNSGHILEAALNSDQINPIVDTLSGLAGFSNPALEASKILGSQIGGLLSKLMQNDRDDMVGYYLGSYNRKFHYPEGKRLNKKATDTTNNMTVHYSFIGYEETPCTVKQDLTKELKEN